MAEPISVRLTEEQRETLRAQFGSVSKGAEVMADIAATLDNMATFFETPTIALKWTTQMFPVLIHRTWEELRGTFTKGELCMIADVLNGTTPRVLRDTWSAGTYVIPNVVDSFALYPGVYEQKWGVIKREMVDKLQARTSFELVAIEFWAAYFWKAEDLNEEGHTDRCVALLGV